MLCLDSVLTLLAGDALSRRHYNTRLLVHLCNELHWTRADAVEEVRIHGVNRADVCHANVNATSVVGACKTSAKRERAAQCRAHTDTVREQ